MMTHEQLEDIFCYHAPTEAQRIKYELINDAMLECAKQIDAVMPAGPGATVAIRKLAEARMAANAAVALEGRF
jgi:hypothetical protein